MGHPYRAEDQKIALLKDRKSLWGKVRTYLRKKHIERNGTWRGRYFRCSFCGGKILIGSVLFGTEDLFRRFREINKHAMIERGWCALAFADYESPHILVLRDRRPR